ncbi:MAG: hypothetical protein WB816_01060 [Methylocystis sp.]
MVDVTAVAEEPAEFERLSKDELVAYAMRLEETEIRRVSLFVGLIGGIQANMALFKSADVSFLLRLAGKEAAPTSPPTPTTGIEEGQIAQALEGVRAGLRQMSREGLIAHIGSLKEITEKRTALFLEFFKRLANDCAAFGGASATLSQTGLDPKKGH